ncbi:MAG: 1,4-alpha-glucan branching protein domain-containing protein [bacterium]
MSAKGKFTFILHSHLPYVLSHGSWPHGTDWLNEAAAETYVPILNMLNSLLEEGYHPKITIGISPVLGEQLAHPDFKAGFVDYCKQKIKAAQADVVQFSRQERKLMLSLAEMWQNFYQDILDSFIGRYRQDIPASFGELQRRGAVELMTCGATHGYYPLLSQDTSLQAQTNMAVKSHTRLFGARPRGIWLPECAYRPRYEWTPPVESAAGKSKYLRKGADEFLSEAGLDYFVIDSVLLKGGKAVGVYMDRFEALKRLWGQFEGQYAPRDEQHERSPLDLYLVNSSGENKRPVAIFTRDPGTGLQVWSGEHGYPGDGNYLDFHKKHFPGGHRYWKVTSAKADLADKLEYYPPDAEARLPENAAHFVSLIEATLTEHYEKTGRVGILAAPFDAELFGHWWFEGVNFLGLVLKMVEERENVELTTASEYLDQTKPTQVVSIPEGSWGEGGYHYIWLNEWVEWTWKHIYNDELAMQRLARLYKDSDNSQLVEIVKQAARELMLLSASDWQFLISTWSARDYAELRLTEHHQAFQRLGKLADKLAGGEELTSGERAFVADCGKRDQLFVDIELDWFAEVKYPPN